jgi:hypothetical protein
LSRKPEKMVENEKGFRFGKTGTLVFAAGFMGGNGFAGNGSRRLG